MLFNSLSFLAFFPIVTCGYFALPHSARWFWLLLASCVFYCWFVPKYLLILLLTIVVDYWAGILIEGTKNQSKKNAYLVISLIVTLLILFFFKYFNFAVQNLNGLADFLDWNLSLNTLEILLPIGLSFHTFQSMSYVIEVYRGKQKAERHFGIYSLYVMFYPQLVAGPIERPQNLLYQFHETHLFSYENMRRGLILMTWGMFKKVVIADRLAVFVNEVYGTPEKFSGGYLAVASIFFAFQIYCDFSGYSDIAIGSARVMGFGLMTNFRRPYFSKTVSEFWKRWHISLSTWFQDYVYYPLRGSRTSRPRWIRNVLLVFLISGIWHGSNWTFVVWGALNGLFLVFENLSSLGEKQNRWPWFGVITTFLAVDVSWVFFRARSVGEAWYILSNFSFNFSSVAKISQGWIELAVASSGIVLLCALERSMGDRDPVDYFETWSPVHQKVFYNFLVLSAIFSAASGFQEALGFIYFQF